MSSKLSKKYVISNLAKNRDKLLTYLKFAEIIQHFKLEHLQTFKFPETTLKLNIKR